MSLNVNHEDHLIRLLADICSSSSTILETYTSKQHSKHDDSNKTTWSKIGGQFTTDRNEFVSFSLPEFNLNKQLSRVFHEDDRPESSSTYDMIIVQDVLGKLGIILNFKDKTGTGDADTIPMKDTGTLANQEPLTEAYLTANEPETLFLF